MRMTPPFGLFDILTLHQREANPRAVQRSELGFEGEALSRCRVIGAKDLVDDDTHAEAAAARHVSVAEARKARCILAEIRWR